MEKITNIKQCKKLKDNVIFCDGKKNSIALNNTEIILSGTNNLLYIEEGVTISNSKINFRANNSIIYLSKSDSYYCLNCFIDNNSVIFIGEQSYTNSYENSKINLWASEQQNILIGKDNLLSFGIHIRTSDSHAVYDSETKKRISLSKSVLIGDHVWIGQDSLILKGSIIGSGAIIGANSLCTNKTISSNTSVAGSPVKLIKDGVFFLRPCVNKFLTKDTLDSMEHEGDEFIYFESPENMNMSEIDQKLKAEKDVNAKLELIKKHLINYDYKNRFYLKQN